MAVGSKLSAGGAGRDLVASDVTLGAGFGTAPVLTIEAGSNRSKGGISILAKATAAQATATVAIVFPEPFDNVPVVAVTRDTVGEGDPVAATHGWVVTARSATGFTAVVDTVPVADDDISFTYVVVE